MTVDVLDREMYTQAAAARLLRVPQSTLDYWLEGGERRGRRYRPVIRQEPRGKGAAVTWAEFVEATLLREYRRTHGVPMAELRAFIDKLREGFGIPYPLADRRPLVHGRELVLEAQETAGLDPEFCLVSAVRGHTMLLPPADAFLRRVDWDGDTAAAWRPHDDPASPVRCLPNRRAGRPSVGGISTVVLAEHVEAGEDVDEVAVAFDLTAQDVRWALAYETSTRAA